MLIIRQNDNWTTAEKPKKIKLFVNKDRNDFCIYVISEELVFPISCATLDGAKTFYKELLLNWDNPCVILTEDGDLISIENFEI